jgi:hypothetical protein
MVAFGCGGMPDAEDRAALAAADGDDDNRFPNANLADQVPSAAPPDGFFGSWQAIDKGRPKDMLAGVVKVRFNSNLTARITKKTDKGEENLDLLAKALAYKSSGTKGERAGYLVLGPSYTFSGVEWLLDGDSLRLGARPTLMLSFARVVDKNPWTGNPKGAVCGVVRPKDSLKGEPFDLMACAEGLTCTGPAPAPDAKPFGNMPKTYGDWAKDPQLDVSGVKTCAERAPDATAKK